MNGLTVEQETMGLCAGMNQYINGAVRSDDLSKEHERLSKKYGSEVWDTKEMSELFDVEGFMAPFVVVIRKSDNKIGTLMFQDNPRFYFQWSEHEEET